MSKEQGVGQSGVKVMIVGSGYIRKQDISLLDSNNMTDWIQREEY